MSWLEGCQKQDEIKWLDGGYDKSGASEKKKRFSYKYVHGF